MDRTAPAQSGAVKRTHITKPELSASTFSRSYRHSQLRRDPLRFLDVGMTVFLTLPHICISRRRAAKNDDSSQSELPTQTDKWIRTDQSLRAALARERGEFRRGGH